MNSPSDPTAASPAEPVIVAERVADAPRAGRPAAGRKLTTFIDNPWVVLGLVFFAMMFLGIPLIWKSRGFSLAGKIFWTLAALAYSALVLWLFFLVMAWAYHTIAQALGYA